VHSSRRGIRKCIDEVKIASKAAAQAWAGWRAKYTPQGVVELLSPARFVHGVCLCGSGKLNHQNSLAMFT